MSRIASVSRKTSESTIDLEIDLDGSGKSSIVTTVPFFDHLLTAFAKHALVDLTVQAQGDAEIDVHHTVEDTGHHARHGDQAGARRQGRHRAASATPSCRSTRRSTQAVVDISGRPYLVHTGEPAGFDYHLIGGHFTGAMVRHAFEAIVFNAGITVHLTVLAGRDPHHIAESEFKAFARAFRQAVAPRPEGQRHPVDEGRALDSMAAPDRRGPRLRLGQRALGRQGARGGRRPGRADRRPRRAWTRPTASWCPGSARSPRSWRGSTPSTAGCSSSAGSPAGARCSASASGCRCMFERGVERGVESEGLGEWPGVVEQLHAPVLPHIGWNTVDAPEDSVLFDGHPRRALLLRPLLRGDRVDPRCRRRVRAAAGHLGRARRAGSSRRSRTDRSWRPSSTRRSPASPASGCSATG